MKTAKEFQQAVTYFQILPNTNRNKFRKAVDLALAQGLPIRIEVARPFRSFKSTEGKGYKVKVVNTRTGVAKLLGRVKFEKSERTDYHRVAGAVHCSSYSLESLDTMRDGAHAGQPYTITGPHTTENVDAVNWGRLALIISNLFKEDFAHTQICGKCSGSGFLPHYAHIDNGVCWDCMGCGFQLVLGEKVINQKAA
jgi:hypothetical protein